MTVSERQIEWMEKVTAVADAGSMFRESQEQVGDALDKSAARVSSIKDELREKMDVTLKEKGTFGGKVNVIDTKTHDAMNELDIGESSMADFKYSDENLAELADIDTAVNKLMKASETLEAELKGMKKDVIKDKKKTKEPLYTQEQINGIIMDEIWTPMVREEIIPDNFVPKRFSKTEKVFEESGKLYDEALEKYSETLQGNEGFLEAIGLSKEMVSTAKTIGGNIASMVGSKEADIIIAGVGAALESGHDALSAGVKKDVRGVIDATVAIVGSSVGTADSALGSMITGAYKGLTKSADAGKLLAEGKFDEAVNSMADAMGSSIALLSNTKISDSTGTAGSRTWAEVGGDISHGIKSSVKIKNMIKVLHEGRKKGEVDWAQFTTVLTDVMKDQGKYVNQHFNAIEKARKLEGVEDKDEQYWIKKGAKGKGAGIDSATEGVASGIGGIVDMFSEEEKKEVEKKLVEQMNASTEDELERSRKEFETMLAHGFPVPNSTEEQDAQKAAMDMRSIETLIKQIEKDRKILAMVENLSKAGDIVEKLVPAMGGYAAARDLALNAYKAYERAKEVHEWRDNLRDTKNAHNIYGEAFMNRLNNAAVLLTRDISRAMADLARLIGYGAQHSPIAPAGVIVAKSAESAKALMEVAAKAHDMRRAAVGWKVYKSAIESPMNRKLKRSALRLNATLSKYAMVHGALVDKDPFAKNAMAKCGLDARVLSHPDTNSDKVMKFLTVQFNDDPVVMRAVPLPKDWREGIKVELTYESWISLKVAAETNTEPAAKPMKSGVDGALAKVVKLSVAFEKTEKPVARAEVAVDEARDAKKPEPAKIIAAIDSHVSALEKREKSLKELRKALGSAKSKLNSFKPLDVYDSVHTELAEDVKTLAAQATLRDGELRVSGSQMKDMFAMLDKEKAAQEETLAKVS